MNRNSTDEKNMPGKDISENRMAWQKPELIIFDIDKTHGGALNLAESNDGGALFS